MATINLGNLAFTHKGDYDGSTAYVKNDVVYYSSTGSAYIAKQSTTGNLPTSTAHWNIFSAGSGGIWNAGLSLGSAGQVVKVNSGASALEFGTVSSDFVRIANLNLTSGTKASFDNVFSSSDGYQSYKCIVHAFKPVGDYWLKFKWRNSGSDLTDHYKWRVDGWRRNNSNNNTHDTYGYNGYSYGSVTFWSQRNDGYGIMDIDLGNPSRSSNGHFWKSTATTYESNNGIVLNVTHGTREATATYDGFCLEINNTSYQFTVLDVSVYGIK